MSRLTGSDALGLFEAYQTIYSPQELTEEQVWEEVENWVNSLVEEGYDLSDYTWEEMYESYLSEMGQTKTTGQSTSVAWKPTPGAGSAGGSGSGGRRGTGNSPGRLVSTSKPSAAPKPSFQQSGGYGRYSPGSQQVRIPSAPAKPTAAPARPTAAPARPTAAPARPAVKPSGGTPPAASKPTAAKTPTPTPRVKDTSITDMIGRSQVRQGAPVNTGNTSSDIRAIAGRSSVGASPSSSVAKPTPSTPSLQQSIRSRRLNMDLNLFDVVMGHLLDEGYADTEESALKIMANMSEEWRQSIVEGGLPNFGISPYSTTGTAQGDFELGGGITKMKRDNMNRDQVIKQGRKNIDNQSGYTWGHQGPGTPQSNQRKDMYKKQGVTFPEDK